MKKISKILLNATALLTVCTLQSSALADTPEIKTGLYAPATAKYSKMFHNTDSFICMGTGSEACQSFVKGKKFTSEEKELVEGGYISGDLKFTKDKDSAEYSVSGSIHFIRICELGTGVFSKTDDTNEFESKSVKCRRNDDGSISCPFVNPDETEQGDAHAVFTFRPAGSNKLKISAQSVPGMDEIIQDGCLDSISDTLFEYETEEEYAHNMYVSSKLQFLMADDNLNRSWRELSKAQRDRLLAEQKKWVKEKDTKCGPVTKKGSEGELTKMYRCQYEMTNDKYFELASMRE
jgi:uncharacterized protein YecT (DUF1311 family)